MAKNNNNYLEGIYFSKITGRIFEATRKNKDSIFLRFADTDETKIIENRIFFSHVEVFEFYDILIDYNEPFFRLKNE
jgi:hypothetical protein